MKKNKVIFKNINKKILTGSIVLGITATTLTGCSKPTAFFEYTTNEQGQSVCNNVIKYSNISNDDYKVIWIMENTDIDIYMTKKEKITSFNKEESYFNYYDIFGTNTVYADNSDDTMLLREVNLEDYLINYDKVQEEYTEEEMQEILVKIKNEYEQNINKKMIKEK